ncbi:NADH-quinone oxidoreductase subunit M [Halorhodospira abdelmalekii]|uniref:NADH-quinone oxidoreductase subunit M n=1 Tax=Halorhodospira abdelmalekii TaxID=421629 RepID=UPI001904C4AA|nr:NADH-quinone oxidoreductase subunit M [Halorhodospira abdelmalekii]MBK1734242.1 NADH-quinone oxidoreductase subunit M [Halorhodospira abdelmalekii]
MFDGWLLSLIIWVPIFGGAAVLAVGARSPQAVRALATAVAGLTFLLTLVLWIGFDPGAGMQFVEKRSWVPSFDIHYHLGVDGISMPLVVLTAFATLLVVVAAWRGIEYRLAQYMGAFLIMEGLMVGVFAALDAILFYVFWEAMLVPMFLLIGIWGGTNRIYATIKFFLYTFLGSVLMLIAFLYLRWQAESFGVLDFHGLGLPFEAQILIFLALLAAFAVKVPMWPVHTWLPDAHTEAPTGGSVILAAITLKMGAYGFLRFALPIAPEASQELAWLVIAMSLIAIVYIGLVAMVQEDMKRLIAYSSIAHMGFATLGFFVVFQAGLTSASGGDGGLLAMTGGYVQLISHGFISAALFLCVGVLYDRMHTRNISDYGGVVNRMPIFAAFFVVFAMANAGLPGTSGFVGEFMVILGSYQASFWYAAIAGLTLIVGAAYSLWLVKRVVFGPVANERVDQLRDLDGRELLLLGVLAVAVIGLGVYPAVLIEVAEPTLVALLEDVSAMLSLAAAR